MSSDLLSTPLGQEYLADLADRVSLEGYVSRVIDDGLLGDVSAGARSLDEVAAVVRGWRSEDREPIAADHDTEAAGEHQWASALVLAGKAADRDDVAAFRADVLGGVLLDDVAAAVEWIRATDRAEAKGRKPWRARHPEGGERHWWDVIVFPDDDFATSLAVRPGGVLDQLRRLADQLASAFPWQPAQATAFVLCDAVPIPIGCRVGPGPAPGLVSVTVHVDTDPAVVAGAFQAERAKVLGPRARLLSPKGARLAAFVAARTSMSWPELFVAWNREHKDNAFRDRRHFRTAATRATQRLERPLDATERLRYLFGSATPAGVERR